jgi:hypothetical protein
MAKLVPGLNTFRPLTATMHVEIVLTLAAESAIATPTQGATAVCVVLGDQERMSYPYK